MTDMTTRRFVFVDSFQPSGSAMTELSFRFVDLDATQRHFFWRDYCRARRVDTLPDDLPGRYTHTVTLLDGTVEVQRVQAIMEDGDRVEYV